MADRLTDEPDARGGPGRGARGTAARVCLLAASTGSRSPPLRRTPRTRCRSHRFSRSCSRCRVRWPMPGPTSTVTATRTWPCPPRGEKSASTATTPGASDPSARPWACRPPATRSAACPGATSTVTAIRICSPAPTCTPCRAAATSTATTAIASRRSRRPSGPRCPAVSAARRTGSISTGTATWISTAPTGSVRIPLLSNDAGGAGTVRFRAVPRGTGAVDPRRTVGACWFDFDRDGDLDLFLANQNGDSDALWRNDGKRFVDVAPALGLDQTQRRLDEGGVGCAPGGLDGDGDPDLYVGTYGRNLLYRNDTEGGAPRFVEVAQAAGVVAPHSVVGAAWGDCRQRRRSGPLRGGLRPHRRRPGARQPAVPEDGGRFRNVLAPDDPRERRGPRRRLGGLRRRR